MVTGQVTPIGEVIIEIPIHGRTWRAIIDTGFNGDLELPVSLFESLEPQYQSDEIFELAAGQSIVEEVFAIQFPFDGAVVPATTTFVDGDTILIGTGLLQDYRLTVDFVARTVLLERAAPGH